MEAQFLITTISTNDTQEFVDDLIVDHTRTVPVGTEELDHITLMIKKVLGSTKFRALT